MLFEESDIAKASGFPGFDQAGFAIPTEDSDTILMKTVAIPGASTNPDKYGNKAVRAFAEKGFEVYPVNPRAAEIEGIETYIDIQSVPKRPNVVSVYLPPKILIDTLPAIAAKGCDELWLNPGTDTPEVITAAEALNLNCVIGCSLVGLVSGQLDSAD